MQDNIDILRRLRRRHVLKTKFQSAADKIDNQGPLIIAVAVSAYDRDRRPNRPQFIQNSFRADIANVPNLIGISRKVDDILRKLVMRVGENKDFHGWIGLFEGDVKQTWPRPQISIELGELDPPRCATRKYNITSTRVI